LDIIKRLKSLHCYLHRSLRQCCDMEAAMVTHAGFKHWAKKMKRLVWYVTILFHNGSAQHNAGLIKEQMLLGTSRVIFALALQS